MSYMFNVLVSIDQLGNSIAGGNPDNTISARVGYFSYHASKWTRWYWFGLSKVIDFTFRPVDGKGHCHKAYHKESEIAFVYGSDLMRFLLSFIIIVTCIPISITLYVLWLFQIVKPREKTKEDIILELLDKIKRLTQSIDRINNEPF